MYAQTSSNNNKNHISFTNNPSQIDSTDTRIDVCCVFITTAVHCVHWLRRIGNTQTSQEILSSPVNEKRRDIVYYTTCMTKSKRTRGKKAKEKHTIQQWHCRMIEERNVKCEKRNCDVRKRRRRRKSREDSQELCV